MYIYISVGQIPKCGIVQYIWKGHSNFGMYKIKVYVKRHFSISTCI